MRDRSSVIVTSSQQTPVQSGTALVLGFPALRGARTTEPTGPSSTGEAKDPDPLDLVALVNGDVDADDWQILNNGSSISLSRRMTETQSAYLRKIS